MRIIQTGSKSVVANVGWTDAARESAARTRAAEVEEKKHTRFAVFPHSEQGRPTGRGHTVRATDEEGNPKDQFNYKGIAHTGKIFKVESAAQRHADQVNGMST